MRTSMTSARGRPLRLEKASGPQNQTEEAWRFLSSVWAALHRKTTQRRNTRVSLGSGRYHSAGLLRPGSAAGGAPVYAGAPCNAGVAQSDLSCRDWRWSSVTVRRSCSIGSEQSSGRSLGSPETVVAVNNPGSSPSPSNTGKLLGEDEAGEEMQYLTKREGRRRNRGDPSATGKESTKCFLSALDEQKKLAFRKHLLPSEDKRVVAWLLQ